MGIPCMNCAVEVSEGQAQIFATVFVCPTCFTVAESMFNRGVKEMQATLTFLKDIIRERLIKGELQFPEQQPEDMSRTEVMRAIVKLQEAYDVSRSSPGVRDSSHQSISQPAKVSGVRALGDGGSGTAGDRPLDISLAHLPGEQVDAVRSSAREERELLGGAGADQRELQQSSSGSTEAASGESSSDGELPR